MAVTPTAATVTRATTLGRRAAEHLTATGVPTRNPFPTTQPQLAAAWRNGYFGAPQTTR